MKEKDLLKEGIERLALRFCEEKIEKCLRYLWLLTEEAKRTNLVGTRDRNEIIKKHIIDSLTLFSVIKRSGRLIDIGTGAGFPGIILAIFSPKRECFLLESVNRKVRFLKYVKEELSLSNIFIISGRAEDYGRLEGFRESFDYGVIRALGCLSMCLELGLCFLKTDGRLIVMKGREIEKEVDGAKPALSVLGGEIIQIKKLSLPFIKEDKRHLVVVKKVKPTPIRYPRRPGLPKKRPITDRRR